MSNALTATGSATVTWRPEEAEAEIIEFDGDRYWKHHNGGGLVALTAIVGHGVHVAPRAMIRGRAVVVGAVRLFDEAVVEESAIVAGCCTLRNRSSVGLDPSTFRYSLLRVFDPSTPTSAIDASEGHFKVALDTRRHGLNRN